MCYQCWNIWQGRQQLANTWTRFVKLDHLSMTVNNQVIWTHPSNRLKRSTLSDLVGQRPIGLSQLLCMYTVCCNYALISIDSINMREFVTAVTRCTQKLKNLITYRRHKKPILIVKGILWESRHGLLNPRNPWSDGPQYITMCGIPSGSNFTHDLRLSTEEGTIWYHAHSDWTRNTVHGAVVVYPKPGLTYPFPVPYKEYVIVIGKLTLSLSFSFFHLYMYVWWTVFFQC